MLTGKKRMLTGLINITALMKRLSGVTIALGLLFAMQPAQASLIDSTILDTEILGGSFFVANDGEVTATFLGSDAGYFNTLYLSSPRDESDGPLFIFDRDGIFAEGGERILHDDEEPTSISLGSSFGAGDELIFSLYVKNTGNTFYTGDSSRNLDDLAHASAITSLVDGVYVTEVGFEDLYGGGDLDYNDFMFSLTNVVDPVEPVPEPSILLLLSGVLFSMIIFLRQRRRTH